MCDRCVDPLTKAYIEAAAELEWERSEGYFKYLDDMGVSDKELDAYNQTHKEKA